MSDFLKQFESGNYQKDVGVDASKVPEPKTISKEKTNRPKQEPISHAEKGHGIIQEEHETQIDTKYHRRKIILYITIAVTAVILAIIGFFIVRYVNQVTVRNFVGSNISEVKNWGLKNKIEIDTSSEYNKEYNQDTVIMQEIEANTKIQKGGIFYVKVSKGADPEEKIIIPDFTTMTSSEIRTWMKDEKLPNTNISQEYNEDIETGKYIRTEFKEGVTADNYVRRDQMTVYVSRGSQKQDKNIEVPNFAGKSKPEVETWEKEKSVKVVYKESGSEQVLEGSVISQSPETGTKIAIGDTVEVTISLGKGITVPNFANFNKDEASTAGQGLSLNVKTEYSQTVPFGKLISQSVKSGTKMYKMDKTIDLVYSEGKPYIGPMVGKTEKDIESYIYEMGTKGIKLTYEFKYIDSNETKGMVVKSNKENEYIEMSQHLILEISKGNMAIMPPTNSITSP